jgi:hypothetical protein
MPGDSMKKLIFAIILFVLGSTTLFAAHIPSKTERIRVLLLDGQSGGPYHAWQLTTGVLKKELEDAAIF